jgi:hypothetical protein
MSGTRTPMLSPHDRGLFAQDIHVNGWARVVPAGVNAVTKTSARG